ncbi:MAG: hypothetical protein AAGA42_02280 [Actinomycetota bacterium]
MANEHRRSRRTAIGGVIVVGLAAVAVAACDDSDDGTPDELLRIDSPAQVDPSFEGLDGRQP